MITAAGPHRILTDFPIIPNQGHLKGFYLIFTSILFLTYSFIKVNLPAFLLYKSILQFYLLRIPVFMLALINITYFLKTLFLSLFS